LNKHTQQMCLLKEVILPN